jgi:hypothetical protein
MVLFAGTNCFSQLILWYHLSVRTSKSGICNPHSPSPVRNVGWVGEAMFLKHPTMLVRTPPTISTRSGEKASGRHKTEIYIPELGEALAAISHPGVVLTLPLAVARCSSSGAQGLDILRGRPPTQRCGPLLLVSRIPALAADVMGSLLVLGFLAERARGEGRRRSGVGARGWGA